MDDLSIFEIISFLSLLVKLSDSLINSTNKKTSPIFKLPESKRKYPFLPLVITTGLFLSKSWLSKISLLISPISLIQFVIVFLLKITP